MRSRVARAVPRQRDPRARRHGIVYGFNGGVRAGVAEPAA